MKTIYVVMGNDYPDAVFSTERAAQKYCDDMSEQNRRDRSMGHGPRIYWRIYPFVVDDKKA